MSLRLWDYRPSGRRVPGRLLSVMFRPPPTPPAFSGKKRQKTHALRPPPPGKQTFIFSHKPVSLRQFRTDSQWAPLMEWLREKYIHKYNSTSHGNAYLQQLQHGITKKKKNRKKHWHPPGCVICMMFPINSFLIYQSQTSSAIMTSNSDAMINASF